MTPTDEAGNTCIILLVEHWSHFPQAYPAKDYTAEGDFVLWNSLENSCDHLKEKLATPWKGVYCEESIMFVIDVKTPSDTNQNHIRRLLHHSWQLLNLDERIPEDQANSWSR